MYGIHNWKLQYLRPNHIGIRYHCLLEKIEEVEIFLKYIQTDDHIADILTKLLSVETFFALMKYLVMEQEQP